MPGDMAVIGVGSGGPAALMVAYLEAHDQATQPDRQRKLWIVDPVGGGRSDDIDATTELLRRLDLLGEHVSVSCRAGRRRTATSPRAPWQ